MHVDIRIKPRRGRGTGLHRSHVGPQGMPGVEIALAVTHLESRAGPSLLGCAGVGQAAANFLPSAFSSMAGLVGVSLSQTPDHTVLQK